MTIPSRLNDKRAVIELAYIALDAIVGTFEQAGVPLPNRQYIAWGDVVDDCEQLTVQVGQLYAGTPGSDPNEVQRCDGPRSVNMVAQLFRKYPLPSGRQGTVPPSTEALNAVAEVFLQDAWLMLDAAHQVDARGWNTGVIAEVSPIAPSGGFAATSMTLTVTVP